MKAAMTMTAAPRERTGRVLTGAALWLLAVSAVLAVVAALVEGDRALLGVLVGAGVVLLCFGFGTFVVGVTAKVVPNAVLLVALLTYTLQLLVLAMVFIAFRDSAEAQRRIADTWLAAGLITATLAWMAGQVVTTLRTPIEPWEPSVSEEPESGATPGPGSTSQAGAA